MKTFALTIVAASLVPLGVHAAANCQHSHSWQCQKPPSGTGTTGVSLLSILPPSTAQVGGTTPSVGSLPQTPHVVVLRPLPVQTITGYGKPPPVTMTLGPTITGTRPPIIVTGTSYTVVGYGKPPAVTTIPSPSFTGTGNPPIVVTGTPGPTITGYGPVNPPQATPGPGITGTSNPPIVVTGTQSPPITGYGPVTPPQGTPGQGGTGTGNPPIVVTGTQGPPVTGHGPVNPPQGTPGPGSAGPGIPPPQDGGKSPTHVLVVHEPPRERPVTSGDHAGPHPYSLEFIEPGIQNHKVEVYRSKDAQQVTYRDINPQDAGGFHLKVIGTRNPEYIY
jgi:hypothetical protein